MDLEYFETTYQAFLMAVDKKMPVNSVALIDYLEGKGKYRIHYWFSSESGNTV